MNIAAAVPSNTAKPTVAYVIDPRFPGGTSSAVAQELRVVAPLARVRVFAISSRAFKGDQPAPQLESVLTDLGIPLEWDPASISADAVILHNPAFLKFQTELPTRILARQLFVVTHENFLRPGGNLSFDVKSCLDQIDRAVLARDKFLAPISQYNRTTIDTWLALNGAQAHWQVLGQNWFNICEFDMQPPTRTPKDRRGRISRAGFEKFPSLADLELSFPKSAQSNLFLGADRLMDVAAGHPHWTFVPFNGMEVGDFFDAIDFMVFHTSPTWRESFGRVVAEAIAAGKVVITDPGTASNFGEVAVVAEPANVSAEIARFINNPATYAKQVTKAQKSLQKFSKSAFSQFFGDHVAARGYAA